MAKLTREEVLKLAHLSRLELSDDEVARFQQEISAILDYVEQLQKADVEGLEPTYQVTGLKNVMREDEVGDYGPHAKELMKNAPDTEDGHFKVKRMIG